MYASLARCWTLELLPHLEQLDLRLELHALELRSQAPSAALCDPPSAALVVSARQGLSRSINTPTRTTPPYIIALMRSQIEAIAFKVGRP